MAEARRHGRYRIEDLRRDLGLSGSSRALFGPLLNIKPFAPDVKFGAVPGEVRNLAAGPVDDLAVTLLLDGDRLILELDGNAALYPEEALAVHARRLARFLSSLALTPPDTPVGRLSLLTEEDEAALPAAALPTGALPTGALPAASSPTAPAAGVLSTAALSAAAPRTVVEAFDEQVRLTPAATALTCAGETLTFGELGARADLTARRLVREGRPRADRRPGAPRSADLVVALLAVLKSGAAFLPVDPSYPADRREFMLADARPPITVTPEWMAAVTPERTALVDPGPAARSRTGADGPADARDAAEPAALPSPPGRRGVRDLHLGLHRTPQGRGGDPPGTRRPARQPPRAAVPRRGAAPGGAHRVVLVRRLARPGPVDDRRARAAPARRRRLPRPRGPHRPRARARHRLPRPDPSHLREMPALLAAPPRITVVGGEAVPEALWRSLRESGTLAVDHYGPTESTVDAYTWFGDGTEGPVLGTRAHVLDHALHPAPPGSRASCTCPGTGWPAAISDGRS
nr:hypothetical protein GCM10020093_049930 [Planobispora longispora]